MFIENLATKLHPNNPRSSWYERIMNGMLGHLERQPKNKERCMAWLRFVEPLLKALGRFLLAHFRRIFPLFFQWTHSDDPETVLLVLERVETVLRLTWIGNSPRFNPKHYKRALRQTFFKRAQQTFFSSCPPYLEATPRVCFYSLMKYTAGPKAYSSESAWRQYQDDPNLVTVGEYNMG
ncbi:unnamed protein product [Brassica oleracea var. botrytis]